MPRKQRAARDGETEMRILNAAKAVFIRCGTAGARMQEIADEAAVNPALLHYYFKTKERLSQAVFRESASVMFPMVIQTLSSDSSIDAKVERIVHTYLDRMSDAPYLPGYIISELHFHPNRITQLMGSIAGADIGTAMQPVLKRLDKQLAAEARAGRMRRITARQFLVNLLSLCIFPFAARPMLLAGLSISDAEFAEFIAQRRRELPTFILSALRS